MKNKGGKRAGLAVLLALAAGIILCWVYVNDYYRADSEAIAALVPAQGVTRQTLEDGTLVFAPEEPSAGLIFYPGGKVEHTAYGPLMEACARQGVLCLLVEMPLRLAVLDVDAAEGLPEQFPQVDRWYMGGHSLGGSMAASYLSEKADDFAGLILLGSYSTVDLSDLALESLSVYGSEDGVLNRENYEENFTNLPADHTELVIDGGCHAGFGMYGPQEGDGTPTITAEEQIRLTAEAVTAFVAD